MSENKITYVKGDATHPQGEGKQLIIHCCNDIGVMGAGVALAIKKKWPVVYSQYRIWYKKGKDFKLGNIQAVRVEKDVAVVNMIGQKDIYKKGGVPPIRYKAIESCLTKVADLAEKYGASVHAPQFGSGLSGGKWNVIEGMLQELICSRDIPVTVYKWE